MIGREDANPFDSNAERKTHARVRGAYGLWTCASYLLCHKRSSWYESKITPDESLSDSDPSTSTNFFDEIGSLTSGNPQIPGDREGAGLGWLATGGLDRCVKVSMLCPTALALGSQYSLRFGMSCHWAQRHICRRLQRTLYKLRFLFEGFYGE